MSLPDTVRSAYLARLSEEDKKKLAKWLKNKEGTIDEYIALHYEKSGFLEFWKFIIEQFAENENLKEITFTVREKNSVLTISTAYKTISPDKLR